MSRIPSLGLLISLLLVAPMWPDIATASPPLGQRAESKGVSTTSRFTITYPDHWIEASNHQSAVVIYNQQPPAVGGGVFSSLYVIKTDAQVENMSLREALQGYRDGSSQSQVRRIEEVTINGRLGVRLWLILAEEWDIGHSIVTYIPVSDRAVIYVVSYYYEENQFAEPAILQVHDSLRLR